MLTQNSTNVSTSSSRSAARCCRRSLSHICEVEKLKPKAHSNLKHRSMFSFCIAIINIHTTEKSTTVEGSVKIHYFPFVELFFLFFDFSLAYFPFEIVITVKSLLHSLRANGERAELDSEHHRRRRQLKRRLLSLSVLVPWKCLLTVYETFSSFFSAHSFALSLSDDARCELIVWWFFFLRFLLLNGNLKFTLFVHIFEKTSFLKVWVANENS